MMRWGVRWVTNGIKTYKNLLKSAKNLRKIWHKKCKLLTDKDVIDKELDKVEDDEEGGEGVEMDIEAEAPLHVLGKGNFLLKFSF